MSSSACIAGLIICALIIAAFFAWIQVSTIWTSKSDKQQHFIRVKAARMKSKLLKVSGSILAVVILFLISI